MTVHLCFHGIGTCLREREPGESRYWVTQKTFMDIIDQLAGRAGVELSFDDGNTSDLEIAVPALRERGLRASFFVLAGRLEDQSSLSATDLRALVAAEMSVGTHGWNHIPWPGLSEKEMRREMLDARVALEIACGRAITSAALPLGRYDRTTLRRLRTAGYGYIYTSDSYRASARSWLQPRYSVTADDTTESVMRIVRGWSGRREVRNVLASMVKRAR